ncbi:hypothetical protein BJ741DRAFT_595817 [Chytriomyces cf. hyalinus JEL632]|nr:hypothetical protein BJ741DRAFT_595817 [Chytriomyces cf. hyalinus JEL632]
MTPVAVQSEFLGPGRRNLLLLQDHFDIPLNTISSHEKQINSTNDESKRCEINDTLSCSTAALVTSDVAYAAKSPPPPPTTINNNILTTSKHTQNNTMTCPWPNCTSEFSQTCSLQTHYSQTHEPIHPHTCNKCNAQFLKLKQLESHKKSVHGTRRSFFVCEGCGRVLSMRKSLKRHLEGCHGVVGGL